MLYKTFPDYIIMKHLDCELFINNLSAFLIFSVGNYC